MNEDDVSVGRIQIEVYRGRGIAVLNQIGVEAAVKRVHARIDHSRVKEIHDECSWAETAIDNLGGNADDVLRSHGRVLESATAVGSCQAEIRRRCYDRRDCVIGDGRNAVLVEFTELLFVAFPNCPPAASTCVSAMPRKLKETMRRQIIDTARSAFNLQTVLYWDADGSGSLKTSERPSCVSASFATFPNVLSSKSRAARLAESFQVSPWPFQDSAVNQ